MKRAQLEHILRAAGSIADDTDIVVVGSQAVLGSVPNPAAAMLASMEADVYPRNHPERADLIDGSIGEGSPFHATFGYYAQGVGPETATLPPGWEARLVPLKTDATRGVTGWCLEVHDLVASKIIAGREKDVEYLRHALDSGIVDRDVLLERVQSMPIDLATRSAAEGRVRATFGGSG